MENMEWKYMMSCGHNSNTKKCPHKCPKSKILIDFEAEQEAEPTKVEALLQQIDDLEPEEKVELLEALFIEMSDEESDEDQGESE